MKKILLVLLIVLIAFTIIMCSHPKGLADAYKGHFLIGTALNADQVMGKDPKAMAIVKQNFNSIVAENLFKWQFIHPKPDTFAFGEQDQFVKFGEENNMYIVGHVLVWHSQTPWWVFQDENGEPASKELLLKRMENHIKTVVGRYKGQIDGWDVVNEALEADGSYRKSPWFNIIGEEYIEKAFQFAHEADPAAELYYNDFDMWKTSKATGVERIVNNLKAKGIRIDGLGIQAHWGMDYPEMDQLDANLQTYRDLGMKVMFTELDLNLLPVAWDQVGADISMNYDLKAELDPYSKALPDSMMMYTTLRYVEWFKEFLKYDDIVTRVTFWGIDDGHSWLNNWPVHGRTAYPLLFDRNYEPKPVVRALIELVKE